MTIELYKGNTENITVDVDFDVSGYSYFLQVREYLSADCEVLIEKSGITSYLDKFIIPLTKDETDLTPGNYVFEIWVENEYGTVKRTIETGSFKILTTISSL